ncbi:LysR family transcriptional regulator [soil metagenome]
MSNRLDNLRVFCAAADARNFRDAARQLSVSPQVITRCVRDLEEALGEPLFHRSTRGVQLTSFGERLAGQARAAVADVDALFPQRGSRPTSDACGIVRLTAPTFIGRQLWRDALAPLAMEHPGLVIDLRLADAIVPVVDEQIDVGVRIGAMRDRRFVARPASKISFSVVAAPALIKRVGAPRTLDELDDKPLTALIDGNTNRVWPWAFKRGRRFLPAAPAFVTNDSDAELDAVLGGVGIGQLASYLIDDHVAAGRLVTLFDDQAPQQWTLYVYRPQRGPVPLRVRLVYDALMQALTQA